MSMLNKSTTAAILIGFNSIYNCDVTEARQKSEVSSSIALTLMTYTKPQIDKVESSLQKEIVKTILRAEALTHNMNSTFTSDYKFWSMAQTFSNSQIELDDDFVKVLNQVTRKIGKKTPSRARF
ncbi:MAG: hypothetical protein NVV82_01710 [Sporocytophaga sp.]|nr:hypothetical protein [Sporocytophaga sp.]